jgi:hypothetical protein
MPFTGSRKPVSRISHASNVGKKRGTAIGFKRELMRTDGQGIGEQTPTKQESRRNKHYEQGKIGLAKKPVARGSAVKGKRTKYSGVIYYKAGGVTSLSPTDNKAKAQADLAKAKAAAVKRYGAGAIKSTKMESWTY